MGGVRRGTGSRPYQHWNAIRGSTDADFARALAIELLGAWMPGSDVFLGKAMLAAGISDAIRERRCTQAQAADLLGLTQPRVSELMAAKLERLSLERLIRCTTALGYPIRIVIGPPVGEGSRAHASVVLPGTGDGTRRRARAAEFVRRACARVDEVDWDPTPWG